MLTYETLAVISSIQDRYENQIGDFTMTKAGRKPRFSTNKDIVVALNGTHRISYRHKMQLIERGFLKVEKLKQVGPGRPEHLYVPTSKGKTLIIFSKNWK